LQGVPFVPFMLAEPHPARRRGRGHVFDEYMNERPWTLLPAAAHSSTSAWQKACWAGHLPPPPPSDLHATLPGKQPPLPAGASDHRPVPVRLPAPGGARGWPAAVPPSLSVPLSKPPRRMAPRRCHGDEITRSARVSVSSTTSRAGSTEPASSASASGPIPSYRSTRRFFLEGSAKSSIPGRMGDLDPHRRIENEGGFDPPCCPGARPADRRNYPPDGFVASEMSRSRSASSL
jgi:hypothetical protein